MLAAVLVLLLVCGAWLWWRGLSKRGESYLVFETNQYEIGEKREFPDFQKQASGSAKKRVSLVATGDVMLGRSVYSKMKEKKDFLHPFLLTSEFLKESDISMINLENPLVDPCPVTEEGMKFCAPTRAVEGLKYAGIDVAGVANNHIRNYGEEGYQSTIETLEGEGIRAVDEANPTVIEKEGVRFGFINFDFTTSKMEVGEVREAVLALKKRVDVVVVGCHWGVEYKHVPSGSQKQIARDLVHAGADLIIGHHPHVVQTVEVVENKLVVYSLGNFVFDQMQSLDTRRGVAGKFVFEGRNLVEYSFVPIQIEDYSQPHIVTDPKTKDLILSWLDL